MPLPAGLVTNSDAITSDISGIPSVDRADLFHLWRVYSTHKHVIAGDVGLRLENFFWRILSKESIHSKINGPTVARLFQHISEGSNFIRTTPTQSPRASRLLGARGTDVASSPPTQRSTDTGSQLAPAAPGTEIKPSSPQTPPQQPKVNTARPPPILKNARGDVRSEHKKTARIAPSLPESPDDEPPIPSTTTTESAATATPTMSTTTGEFARGTRRKKTGSGFVANSSGNRRRPAVARRRSSQTPSGLTSDTGPSSPQFDSGKDDNPPEDLTGETYQSSRLSGLQERIPSAPVLMQSGQFPPHIPRSEIQMPERRLVERGFRSKFDDRKRQGQLAAMSSRPSVTKTSSTIGSTSTAAAAGIVDLGEGQSSAARGKARQGTITDQFVPLRPEGTSGFAAADLGSEPSVPLARTKSQLALLLDRDRQQKGSKSGSQKTLK
ncbi:MAG: hypothetical protein M1812_006178 [Candelaria pacifica]|nr:MAG: hypothetical protein M1812_006178 [Candelaria pacifica]